MRRRREKAFVSSVCFLLAALLLVLMLSGPLRLRAVEGELRALQEEKAELEKEKRILSVRIAGRLSLPEIERLAESELGMRRCRGDQIREIGIEKDGTE